jgi:iron complex transport system substrate-binding protein
MRICSFLPSATEILYSLGLGEEIAGVTYECDFPPQARSKRVVVETRLRPSKDAAEIDRQVNEFMARGESLYRLDSDALREIRPDLILTQDLCRVCAASPGDLGSVLSLLPSAPQVLSLNPRLLADVWQDIRTVGRSTRREREAEELACECERRVAAVEKAVAGARSRPRVLCLEWLDPPFIAGHWVPDMVARAGGEDVSGKIGEPGFRGDWEAISRAQPEIVVVTPCGYHLAEAAREFRSIKFPPVWSNLPAVHDRRVYAVDASSYFSRPGPRLAAGVEILASIIHPDRSPATPPHDAIERLDGSEWSVP